MAEDEACADEVTVVYCKIIFFLADGRLQFLRGEGRSSLGEDLVYNLWRANKRSEFGAVNAVPVFAELLEMRAVAAPEGQFLAIIVPTFSRHGSAGVNWLKEPADVRV